MKKLENKGLHEEDSIDSIDLSLSYGPAHYEEDNRNAKDNYSHDSRSQKATSFRRNDSRKRYEEYNSEDEISKLMIEQTNFSKNKHSPHKNTHISPRKQAAQLAKGPKKKITRQRSDNTQGNKYIKKNDHSLGFPIEVRKNTTGIEDESENDAESLFLKISDFNQNEVRNFQEILKQTETPVQRHTPKVKSKSKPRTVNINCNPKIKDKTKKSSR